MDIANRIEKLRIRREETPAVAAVPSGKCRTQEPAESSIKKAKRSEFAMMPSVEKKKSSK
jgi:hypothetical protein